MVLTNTTVGVPIGPLEGFGSFVMGLDIASDFASKVRSGSEDAAGEQIALNFGEPDFELIEPGRVSRGVVELNVRMKGEELRHSSGLMRRKVIGNDVDLLSRGLGGDDVGQKSDELRGWCGAGRFCPPLARWRPPGPHRAKEYHAGNIQTHDVRGGLATEARPDRADQEPE
jgi:hypothetical protein